MDIKGLVKQAFSTHGKIGTFFDRGDYDPVLPTRVQYLGAKLTLSPIGIQHIFRNAGMSENMDRGETFSLGAKDAKKHYGQPSCNQGKGLIYV